MSNPCLPVAATCRTVKHSPSRYSTPSMSPPPRRVPSSTQSRPPSSSVILRLPLYPVPGIEQSGDQTQDHKHERPGVLATVTAAEPHSEPQAKQCRNRDRPADHAAHPQTMPDAPVTSSPGTLLAPLFTAHNIRQFFILPLLPVRSGHQLLSSPTRLRISPSRCSKAVRARFSLSLCTLYCSRTVASALPRSPATTARWQAARTSSPTFTSRP